MTQIDELINRHDETLNESHSDPDAQAWNEHINKRSKELYRRRKRALAGILKLRAKRKGNNEK